MPPTTLCIPSLVASPPIGEEINALRTPELFYGYPYCWSEGVLPAPRVSVPGRQRVWPPWKNGTVSFRGTPVNEGWCQDPSAVVPPVACLPAHWAPLGVDFQPLPPRGGTRRWAAAARFPLLGTGTCWR